MSCLWGIPLSNGHQHIELKDIQQEERVGKKTQSSLRKDLVSSSGWRGMEKDTLWKTDRDVSRKMERNVAWKQAGYTRR